MEIMCLPRLKRENFIISTCLYDAFATVCHFWGEDIKCIFYDCLNLEYVKERGMERVHDYETKLLEYCGIEVKRQKLKEDIIGQVEELLKQRKKLIVDFYAYYCPSHPSYHMEYALVYMHSFIVEEYSAVDRKFKCCDPFFNKEELYISYEEFILGYVSHFELSLTDGTFKYKDSDLIGNQITQLKKMKYWNDLYRFGEDVCEKLTYMENERVKEYCLTLHELMNEMKMRCFYFSVYLFLVDKRLVETAMSIYDEWNLLAMVMLKQSIRGESCKELAEKVRKMIRDVTDHEKALIGLL